MQPIVQQIASAMHQGRLSTTQVAGIAHMTILLGCRNKAFSPCLEVVVKESLPEDNPIHHTRLDCLQAFSSISQHLWMVPTPSEFALAQNLAKRFFDQYDDLHAWALSEHRKLFHMRNKFHGAHHLTRNTQQLNFRMHHNFTAEDFV